METAFVFVYIKHVSVNHISTFKRQEQVQSMFFVFLPGTLLLMLNKSVL